MNNNAFSYLNFIHFSQLNLWDFKRYISKVVSSKYPIVKLANFINEENKKIKPFDFPEEKFEILGVNNKTGLFDAYIEDGNKINQPYKIVENGFLAYNPYRINVGSIGLKTKEQKYKYISPAYVVFSCKKDLVPEFLYILFRTDKFNELIRENTTGSVRQTLSFSSMGQIQIPLPSLEKQKEIVDRYNAKIKLAEEQEKEAKNLEQEIDEKFCFMLGIKTNIRKINLEKQTKGMRLIHFKDTCRWDYFYFNEGFALIDKCLSEIKFNCVIFETIIKQLINGIDSRNYIKTGIPYLRVANIKPDRICLDDLKYIGVTDKNKKGRVKKGEILITRKGTYGNAVVVDQEMEDKQCVISSEVFKISLKNDKYQINPYFLSYYINSRISKIQMERVKTRGIMGSLSQDALNSLKIAIPAIDVQNEIVDTITKLKAKIEKLNNLAEQNRQLAQEEFEKELFE